MGVCTYFYSINHTQVISYCFCTGAHVYIYVCVHVCVYIYIAHIMIHHKKVCLLAHVLMPQANVTGCMPEHTFTYSFSFCLSLFLSLGFLTFLLLAPQVYLRDSRTDTNVLLCKRSFKCLYGDEMTESATHFKLCSFITDASGKTVKAQNSDIRVLVSDCFLPEFLQLQSET